MGPVDLREVEIDIDAQGTLSGTLGVWQLVRLSTDRLSDTLYVLLTRRIRRDRVGWFGRTGRGWIVLDGFPRSF